MLVLTPTATTVIRRVANHPELPEGAGLRIASTGNGDQPLAVSAASAPESSDQVVEDQGARVFLDAQAAQTLDDKVLDAKVDDNGGVQFLLSSQ